MSSRRSVIAIAARVLAMLAIAGVGVVSWRWEEPVLLADPQRVDPLADPVVEFRRLLPLLGTERGQRVAWEDLQGLAEGHAEVRRWMAKRFANARWLEGYQILMFVTLSAKGGRTFDEYREMISQSIGPQGRSRNSYAMLQLLKYYDVPGQREFLGGMIANSVGVRARGIALHRYLQLYGVEGVEDAIEVLFSSPNPETRGGVAASLLSHGDAQYCSRSLEVLRESVADSTVSVWEICEWVAMLHNAGECLDVDFLDNVRELAKTYHTIARNDRCPGMKRFIEACWAGE